MIGQNQCTWQVFYNLPVKKREYLKNTHKKSWTGNQLHRLKILGQINFSGPDIMIHACHSAKIDVVLLSYKTCGLTQFPLLKMEYDSVTTELSNISEKCVGL